MLFSVITFVIYTDKSKPSPLAILLNYYCLWQIKREKEMIAVMALCTYTNGGHLEGQRQLLILFVAIHENNCIQAWLRVKPVYLHFTKMWKDDK